MKRKTRKSRKRPYKKRRTSRKRKKSVKKRRTVKARTSFKLNEEFGGSSLVKLRNLEDSAQDKLNNVQESINGIVNTTAYNLVKTINSRSMDNVKNVIQCPDDRACIATVVFRGKTVPQEDLDFLMSSGYRIKEISTKNSAVHVTFID